MPAIQRLVFGAAAFLILVSAGCGGAVGTTDVGFRQAYEQINTNALLDPQYSATSKNVLQRYNMGDPFRDDPFGCLQALHQMIRTDNRRDLIFTLAELSYFTAEHTMRAWTGARFRKTGPII